jgi:4-alpha-glucanotransferase
VLLFGDLPLYPAYESADVWAHQAFFLLDEAQRPRLVAGVPPDYLSATGQLWGNPIYAWDALAASDFAWWIERLKSQLALFDLVRIDHFRGLQAYWGIPAHAVSAIAGAWYEAPGAALLDTIRQRFQPLPLVAEDLGVITPPVDALREAFGLPGMRVLQFAFSGDPHNPHLPANYRANTVAYTGTHDNDTTLGWYRSLEPAVAADVDRLAVGAMSVPLTRSGSRTSNSHG